MDHKQQHHQHHQKEREHEKKEHKEHERQMEDKSPGIHPAWFLTVGAVLIVLVVLVWTLYF